MQPTPTPRTFTQKGILQFVCKTAGALFILQVLSTVQRILATEWTANALSQANLALVVELVTNVAICWILITKSDWVAEQLEIGTDEIRASLGMQEFLELIIIIMGLVITFTSASRVLDGVVHYAYMSTQGTLASAEDIFAGLFMLGIGVMVLKYHKRVFSFISRLRDADQGFNR